MLRIAGLMFPVFLLLQISLWGYQDPGKQPVAPESKSSDLQGLVSRIRPSLVVIRVADRDGQRSGMGSGFVVDAKGLIATNLHVIGESRDFTVELWPNRKLPVLAVEAVDRNRDLALIRVDVQGKELVPLPLSEEMPTQGMAVVAFGNPLGMKHSVVQGIVSAMQEIEGQELIQLAMPIEPGNSGGPLVDEDGRVHGIVNMKSAIDQNLGFAIPVRELRNLIRHPSPVAIDRWIRRNGLDAKSWTPLMGAQWNQRSGVIQVSGVGSGFGGRSLCLSNQEIEGDSYEIHVQVKLDDESGAAGIAFHCDGGDLHYGFYPSGSQMRLTCFRGPNVYAWEVLKETPSAAYVPGDWNRLSVRVDPQAIRCFVNGVQVIESRDRTFTVGKAGLAKFRDTNAKFRAFEVQPVREQANPMESAIESLVKSPQEAIRFGEKQIDDLVAKGPQGKIEQLQQEARRWEKHAKQLQRIASDLQTSTSIQALRKSIEADATPLEASLWIAKLDHPEIDVESYRRRVATMGDEVRALWTEGDDESKKRAQLNRYLFELNGYHGSHEEYYHAANCQMDRVIDDGEGMPIALCVLYMAIAKTLDMQIEGIGLPGHFIAKQTLTNGDLVWIDVFDKGAELNDGELGTIVLANVRRPIRESDLSPQSTKEISHRILRNLLGSAERRRDAESMLRYIDALVALEPDDSEYRLMRAALRRQTERWALAVEDIDWLIEHPSPRVEPRELIPVRETLLQQLNP